MLSPPLAPELAQRGTLLAVGTAGEPPSTLPVLMLGKQARVMGSIVGSRKQIRETLDWVSRHIVRPMIERHPLEAITDIFDRMARNEIRHRAVLEFPES